MSSRKKTIYLKSNRIGENELGSILIEGFLNAISEQDIVLDSIVLVNNAVLLTTDENDKIISILKKFENSGVRIYSCGTCLDYYQKRDHLKVGVVGNANDISKILLTNEIIAL